MDQRLRGHASTLARGPRIQPQIRHAREVRHHRRVRMAFYFERRLSYAVPGPRSRADAPSPRLPSCKPSRESANASWCRTIPRTGSAIGAPIPRSGTRVCRRCSRSTPSGAAPNRIARPILIYVTRRADAGRRTRCRRCWRRDAASARSQARTIISAIRAHTGKGWRLSRPPSLTREGIFDALRSRRTYALTGDRIELDFQLNGQPMGQRIAAMRASARSRWR